jgi:hypothetical protein
MHAFALMQKRTQELEEANKLLSKRRRAKKTRLQHRGSLTLAEAQEIRDQKDVDAQIKEEIRAGSGWTRRTEPRQRRCGRCGQPGHNSRTCEIEVETFEEDDPE